MHSHLICPARGFRCCRARARQTCRASGMRRRTEPMQSGMPVFGPRYPLGRWGRLGDCATIPALPLPTLRSQTNPTRPGHHHPRGKADRRYGLPRMPICRRVAAHWPPIGPLAHCPGAFCRWYTPVCCEANAPSGSSLQQQTHALLLGGHFQWTSIYLYRHLPTAWQQSGDNANSSHMQRMNWINHRQVETTASGRGRHFLWP